MTDQELKDLVASLAISQKETGKQLHKTDEQLQRTDEQLHKTDEQLHKTDEQLQKTDEQLQKTDKQLQKTIEQSEDTKKTLKNVGIHLGGITKSQGKVAEEFFYNSIRTTKTVASIKYDEIFKNLKKDRDNVSDEYDILLVNGKDILIIETKYRAKSKDLNKLINKKYKNFKKLFPIYKDYNHHLALASFQIEDNVREKALKNGVLVLQRKGKLIESFLP